MTFVDDPSAIWTNPANMTEVNGMTALIAPNFVFIESKFDSPATGQSASTRSGWKFLPNFFATVPIKEDKLTAGIGITTPYGLSNDWDRRSTAFAPGGVLRYTAPYFTELKAINLNPSLSHRVNDWLSIGGGVDIMWSDLDFRQIFPWSFFGGTDGQMIARAQGVGYGGNFGITLRLDDRQRIAITYRSPIKVQYDGKFTVENPLFGVPDRSDFSSEITFPTIVGAAYGIQLTETFNIEASFEWLQWSKFETLPLNVGAPPPGVPNEIRQHWSNGFTAGLGAGWEFTHGWTLNTSYQYYDSPIPEYNYSPSIPGSDQHVFTVGLGFETGPHRLGLAFGESFYERREITNNQTPAFHGSHNTVVHMISLSYQRSF